MSKVFGVITSKYKLVNKERLLIANQHELIRAYIREQPDILEGSLDKSVKSAILKRSIN